MLSDRCDRRGRGLRSLAYAVLWLFVFSIPWEDQLLVPELGTLTRVIGAVAFVAGLFTVVTRGYSRRMTSLHLLILLPVLWSWFSVFWTVDVESTLGRGVTYLQLMIAMWLIWVLAPDESRLLGLIQAFVLGTYVSGGNTIINYLLRKTSDYQRYAASGFNADDLGLILAISMPFGYYLSIVVKHRLLAWMYRIHPVMAGVAILLTATRGAFVCAAVGLLFIPLAFRLVSARQKLALVIVAIATLAGTIRYVPQTSWQRIATIAREVTSATVGERAILWKAGLEVFQQHVFLGVGSAGFTQSTEPILGFRQVAHNTLLSVMVEGGLVGLALFLVMLTAMVLTISRLPTLEKRLWGVVMLVWIVGVSTLSWEHRKATWLLYSLLAAHPAALARLRAWRERTLPSAQPLQYSPYYPGGSPNPNRAGNGITPP